MLQLTQKLKNGEMSVLDVPVPALASCHVLVRNHYSLISAGTEGSTVKTARSGYLAKAKERPQQVRQVLDTLGSQGVVQTYRAVMKKLDAYSPLGYSTAGEVIAVAPDVTSFRVGDRVACAGLGASHAEVVSVPVNLCVRLRPDADLRQAAYNTLGAIAMQGVRQADLRLGESCCVIGLGLLGQLTALILRASGVRTVGVDIDSSMVRISGERCVDLALSRDAASIEDRIISFTNGIGCDAVIITAATSSTDPINFAGAIARKRGTVVVVGAVPTGFDRDPHYYRKELQLRMSCSYGPGRYDPIYEEKGIDYPAAHVRWTEKRNMEAFQELLAAGRMDVSYLTTHTFALRDAPSAYELLMGRSDPFIGILIEYDTSKSLGRMPSHVPLRAVAAARPGTVELGFIGAGSYAQSHLLPNIPRDGSVVFRGVVTATGAGARSVADRFGFEFCGSNPSELIESPRVNTLFIATRHDSHARYVEAALRAGRNVFVEKPLCLTPDELESIVSIRGGLEGLPETPLLTVGFNRRFSPLARFVTEELGKGPKAMIYRVNAGAVPTDSWLQDPAVGGGRIVGEACHFIDFLIFLCAALPVRVHAEALRTPGGLNDTVTISLGFDDGSIGTVAYFANGDKKFPKERVEIFAGGAVAVIDDFRAATVHSGGKSREKKLMVQDKGQKALVRAFMDAVIGRGKEPIPFAEIVGTTRATFAALESLRLGRSVDPAGDGLSGPSKCISA